MGAHAAGELASKLAADNIPHNYHKLTSQPPSTAIAQAVKEANKDIYHRGQTNTEFQGMGTTTSLLLLLAEGALVAHVGDSRVYRLRANGQFEQLTFDHSLVWELRARGQLKGVDPDQVPSNIITRSLGPSPDVEVDLEGPFQVEQGDTFLLCSDGLSGQMEDDELGMILASVSPEKAAQTFVDIANLRGGPDNITLIIVKVKSPLTPVADEDSSDEIVRDTSSGTWVVFGWVFAFILLVGGVLFGVFGYLPLALIGIIGAIITSVFVFQYQPREESGGQQMTSGRYGRGPYQMCMCTPDEPFTVKLSGLATELRQAATNEDWAIDWHAFNSLCESAEAAVREQQFKTAVGHYCDAISFMMSELRSQRKKDSQKEEKA